MTSLNPNSNASETMRHLQDQIRKEMEEISQIQREITEKHEDASKRRAEIPQLQKKLDEDRHEIYVDETTEVKLKSKLAELQREKLKLQNEVNATQRSFQDNVRKMNQKLR